MVVLLINLASNKIVVPARSVSLCLIYMTLLTQRLEVVLTECEVWKLLDGSNVVDIISRSVPSIVETFYTPTVLGAELVREFNPRRTAIERVGYSLCSSHRALILRVNNLSSNSKSGSISKPNVQHNHAMTESIFLYGCTSGFFTLRLSFTSR